MVCGPKVGAARHKKVTQASAAGRIIRRREAKEPNFYWSLAIFCFQP